MSMNVEKRTEPVEMQYSASSHLGLLYLTTILEESQQMLLYILRRITVAVCQNLNCYMINVKKDKCCSKLAAAI